MSANAHNMHSSGLETRLRGPFVRVLAYLAG